MKSQKRILKICSVSVVLIFGLWPVIGFHRSHSLKIAFDSTRIGDLKVDVINRFGQNSKSDSRNAPFLRYANSACQPPCFERLWYENRLLLDTEAWSISIGQDGRVVDKVYWTSP